MFCGFFYIKNRSKTKTCISKRWKKIIPVEVRLNMWQANCTCKPFVLKENDNTSISFAINQLAFKYLIKYFKGSITPKLYFDWSFKYFWSRISSLKKFKNIIFFIISYAFNLIYYVQLNNKAFLGDKYHWQDLGHWLCESLKKKITCSKPE